jgi:hypothetical protein
MTDARIALDLPAPSIRTLGLDRTEWLDIPDGYLANFPNLRALLPGHSFRRKIPGEAFSLPELTQLDFEGNPLAAQQAIEALAWASANGS